METGALWIPTAERLNNLNRASLFNRSAAGAGTGPDSTGRSLRDQPEACILSHSAAGNCRAVSVNNSRRTTLLFTAYWFLVTS